MCILIVLRGAHASHPIVVAANRDERLDRLAAPPGLWVGERTRVLSPRDRQAGGTWLAVDEHGRFAGLTNIAGAPPVPDSPSRGHLPHLVLDRGDLGSGLAAVAARVAATPHAAFQLVVCDGRRTFVGRHVGSGLQVVEWLDPVLVATNQHPPGALHLRGLPHAAAAGLELGRRLEVLAALLRDRGEGGQHAVCKRGEHYGTVSSSLLAVPSGDLGKLIWRYAPGPPDVTAYRNYGNLGRRLLPDGEPG